MFELGKKSPEEPAGDVEDDAAGEERRLIEAKEDEETLKGDRTKEHEELLEETKRICLLWIILVSVYTLIHGARIYVVVFYSRSLGEKSESTISAMILSHFTLAGICDFIFSSMADYYSFDKVFAWKLALTVVAIGVEASAVNFPMFSIGFVFGGCFRCSPNFNKAYVVKMLPPHVSHQYANISNGTGAVMYLVGPVAGGFIAYFISYRACFIAAWVTILSVFIYFMLKVYGTEKTLTERQMSFKEYYASLKETDSKNVLADEDQQWPCCNINEDQESSLESMPAFWSRDGFPLYAILIGASFMAGTETILASWWAPYLKAEHNSNILIANLQIALFSIVLINTIAVGMRRLQPHPWFQANMHTVLVLCHLLAFCLPGFALVAGLGWYWFLVSTYGVAIGLGGVALEVLITLEQPKDHTGKIGGFRALGLCVSGGISAFFVGQLWHSGCCHAGVFIVFMIWIALGLFFVELRIISMRLFPPMKDKQQYETIQDADDNN